MFSLLLLPYEWSGADERAADERAADTAKHKVELWGRKGASHKLDFWEAQFIASTEAFLTCV